MTTRPTNKEGRPIGGAKKSEDPELRQMFAVGVMATYVSHAIGGAPITVDRAIEIVNEGLTKVLAADLSAIDDTPIAGA